MDARYEEIKKIADDINSRTTFKPDIAIVLGSGLGDLVKEIQEDTVIPYSDIEGFPVPTVEGHEGKIVFGFLCGRNVVAFEGRTHYYECLDMEKVVKQVRIIKAMGLDNIILTNAAGGINKEMKVGDVMVINDQITNFVPSPLLGDNIEEFGTRFPDMTHVYDEHVVQMILTRAKEMYIPVTEGVYVQTTGPNYETPAEIKMFEIMGAGAVGMSTACEAMVAKHMGMKVCGISCITNMAAGMAENKLTHEDVNRSAAKYSYNFKTVVKEAVKVM